MRFIYFISLFVVFLIGVVECRAETVTGCKIGNDEFLYTGYQGQQPYPVSQWYIPTFPTYTLPKKDFLQAWYNNYSSCPQFVGNPSYGAQCAVQGITIVSNGQVKNLGNTITYTITYNCPLDRYVVVLFFAISASSVFYIRKISAYSS
ncbi:hypothetical protein WG904_00205 [Pedobacter sp. Du54]|uniref:hypothetical protein n=1 Tax=Pedobacter anseongensis TaxID=3133439 RepID=UPI0030A3A196